MAVESAISPGWKDQAAAHKLAVNVAGGAAQINDCNF
jgi:hypothetical protein